MARSPKSPKSSRQVDALKHDAASRKNIPTAEMESFFRRDEDASPMPPKHYPRARPLAEGTTRTAEEPRAPELIWNGATIKITDAQMKELAETGTLTLSDAQLVWRGKDRQDWSDLVVNVPPLYIQEKIHPKAIIDDLKRRTAQSREAQSDAPDLFADFNGIEPDQRAEFYQHDQHWSNRMILGDSLQVMASLAERESLRGKVQCIFFDPPYGIKFNSNWQVSTQSRDVRDGKQIDISREPEQVKAFRDTWKDGIHSYLAYLRDRLTVMRDLLTESGSIFVQISDENMHRVRALLDEIFGEANFASLITFRKKMMPMGSDVTEGVSDYLIWYSKNRSAIKSRPLFYEKSLEGEAVWADAVLDDGRRYKLTSAERRDHSVLPSGSSVYQSISMLPAQYRKNQDFPWAFEGREWNPPKSNSWKTDRNGMQKAFRANRLHPSGSTLRYILRHSDYPVGRITNLWADASGATQQTYVVQTNEDVVKRCILMATDPGDLVLDPTCGSGTTAHVAEQWGRRWITIDTSRVALALARTRLMSARYPWYLLADSREGRAKEAALTQTFPPETPVHDDIRQGFVYERVPHITLRSIASNPLIDDIWEKWQPVLETLRSHLNAATGTSWEEWQIPRELPDTAPTGAAEPHSIWWETRIARQREIDASIAARADVEFLYDKPYTDNARVRVAGPFTVESLSPHRVLPASDEELIDLIDAAEGKRSAADADLAGQDFAAIVIDYLKSEGVKQQDKGDRITFDSLTPWPGNFVGASGTFIEGENGTERRAAILIGPEYGTVGRQDIVAAAREAVDARFDVLIACAFNFDAHSSELGSLGSLTILKARINPDMHMSQD